MACIIIVSEPVSSEPNVEGMGDVGSARYESALLPPCPTIRVLEHGQREIYVYTDCIDVKLPHMIHHQK